MGNRLQRRNYGTNHSYTLDGDYAPGVTTVLGTGLAIPFGIPSSWAARVVAEFVADNTEWLIAAPNRQFVVDGLKSLARNQADTAAARGNVIHGYAERFHDGGAVELDPAHEHLTPVVQHVAELLDEWDIVSHAVEIPLALTQLRVCGTTDLLARSAPIVDAVNRMRRPVGLPELDPDALGVLDYKTGNALRDKDRVQVEAYRRADLAHIDGVEQAMPELHWAGLIHATPTHAELHLIHPTWQDPLFRLFRAALYEWEALDEKRGWIRSASQAATIGTLQ